MLNPLVSSCGLTSCNPSDKSTIALSVSENIGSSTLLPSSDTLSLSTVYLNVSTSSASVTSISGSSLFASSNSKSTTTLLTLIPIILLCNSLIKSGFSLSIISIV